MAGQNIFNFDAFRAHAAEVGRHFEMRRKKFLRHFKWRSLVAAILIVSFPFWYSYITQWDTGESGLSSLATFIVHVLAAFIILILIVAVALRPVFRYRYDVFSMGSNIPNASSTELPGVTGAVHQTVLLKSRIFTELLKYFGDFIMYEERKPPLRRFQQAPNLPVFDVYEASDYINGVLHDVRVDIAETSLHVQHGGESRRIFRGLFILMDINDTKTVLRGKFSGQTVLMLQGDAPKELLIKKYDGFSRVQLPDSSYGQQVTAFSTNPEEAKQLLTSDFVAGVLKLEGILSQAKDQESAADDKFIGALEHIAKGIGDMLAVAASGLMQWFRTGSFRQLSMRHHQEPPADLKIAEDGRLFSSGLQCSFFDDKILITIPSNQNLFEPDSLFHPPLAEADIELCYKLMSTIATLADNTVTNLPKELLN